jgi:GntR family transcriptional regulator, transcriptional repressor for pyruvate dehydrogenase complex
MVHKSGGTPDASSRTAGASASTQRPGKVSEFVVAAIRDYIATNQLKPGAKLPPERFFIDQLGVSRSSVREGLRALTALDVVDVRHGDGMYVGAGNDPARSNRGRGFDATEENALRNLVETRLGIEFAAVRATTQRATDEDFDALAKLLDDQERALKRNQRWEPLAFELAVAEISGNSWLSEVELMLRDAWLTLSVGLRETVGRHREWLAEHRAILASMRARNVLQAERLLVAHLSLERFEEDLKSGPAPSKQTTSPKGRTTLSPA